jgi:hypothetical protein
MQRFLPFVAFLLLAGVPLPSIAMIVNVKVVNVSTNCAWITPYRNGSQFGPPRHVLPGQSHIFDMDNAIVHRGGGGQMGGVMTVRYGSLAVRAELKGPGTNCGQGTTKDIRTANLTSIGLETRKHLTAELRGSPAHYHIEVMGM